MKRTTVTAFLLLALLPFLFTACIKDNCRQTYSYSYYVPVYKTKQEVRDNIRSNAAKAIKNPGQVNIYGQYIFLNDLDAGIHVIDNSNPAQPRNVAFIDIPGNMQLAIKGNILYADLYTDLVALDISNPMNVVVKKIRDGVFPYRYYSGGFTSTHDKVITEWVRKDTTITISCDNNDRMVFASDVFFSPLASGTGGANAYTSQSPIGKGGSTSRFTLINNRLYAVSSNQLEVFNIANPIDPVLANTVNIGWNIETIYPFKNKLFIGSQSGMFIYDVTNPDVPAPAGQFSHTRSCDPVIADDNYAYVTLRSGTLCQGFTNQLEILQLNNLSNPTLVKQYPLTNPRGLSKDGNLLFICDGQDGLKVYSASDVSNLQLIKQFSGFEANDVIAFNNVALVIAKTGLFQYNYTNPSAIQLISSIPVNN